MLNGNGHSNGHHERQKGLQAPDAEAVLSAILPNPENTRAEVALILSSAQRNIEPFLADPGKLNALVAVLNAIIADPTSRQRVRAAEVLLKATAAAVDQSIRIAEMLDKSGRLDRGESTENVGHLMMTVEEATPPRIAQ